MARKPGVWFREGRGWYTTLKGKQMALGVNEPLDEKGARAALDAIHAIVNGISAPVPAAPESAPENWRERAGEWIAHKERLKLKPKTIKEYKWNLDRFLKRFGDSPRAEITAAAVDEHSHSFGWGVNQRGHYIRTAVSFLGWCGHPLKIRRAGFQSAGAEVVISEALHKRAVAVAPGDVAAILVFMWHTGCRPSEACTLTGECVDWTNGTAKLKEHKTAKKGKVRMLYLSDSAQICLKAQRQKYGAAGCLFRNRFGRQYAREGLTNTMLRISEKIGARVTAYGYRHSYATRALERGLPDVQVAALLGHASTSMVHAHYSHIDANSRLLKSAAAKLDVPDAA